MHLLHNSETPASVFALLEAASGNKTVALVADNLFDLLMLKLSNFYTAKKQTKIESRGPRFEAGDFLVKLGSVTMGPAFKGILVEVYSNSRQPACNPHIPHRIDYNNDIKNTFISMSLQLPYSCARCLSPTR